MSIEKNQLEAELIRANTLLRTVIDENPNIILMKDWNGKFLIGNRALATLYGTTPEDLVGKDDGAFNPNAEQVEFYLENVREIMTKNVTRIVMEESTNAATGETRYFQSIKKPLVTEKGEKQILVIANDVTTLKNTQQKLEDSERRLSYVLQATGEGIWDWNIPSGIVSHNSQWCKIVGLNDGYLLHTLDRFSELIHDEDKAAVFQKIDASLKGQGPYHSEHRMRLRNGEIIWVQDRGDVVERDANGTAIRMVGSCIDITERKSTELALNNRTELLNTIFELSPDAFVSFDHAKRVAYINPAFTRMTNLPERQLLGLDMSQFLGALNRYCAPAVALDALSQLQTPNAIKDVDSRVVIELTKPCKRILEVLTKSSTLKSVSQILYFRDITHEYEVDQMKSEFLSTAAHELRTPMASIYGYAEVLLNQPNLSVEENHEFLQTIFNQSKLMTSIINELLDIARIEARRGKDFIFAKVELPELLKEITAGFKFNEGRFCKFKLEDDCKVAIHADRKKMIQAVSNVISNAFKYSAEDSEVSLDVICPMACQTLPTEKAAMVGIRVTDHGIGMTQPQLKRVFERFYRADTSGKIPGTGLGMSIVKEIVTLHHGSVEISSILGQGTVVTIWLPIIDQE